LLGHKGKGQLGPTTELGASWHGRGTNGRSAAGRLQLYAGPGRGCGWHLTPAYIRAYG